MGCTLSSASRDAFQDCRPSGDPMELSRKEQKSLEAQVISKLNECEQQSATSQESSSGKERSFSVRRRQKRVSYNSKQLSFKEQCDLEAEVIAKLNESERLSTRSKESSPRNRQA